MLLNIRYAAVYSVIFVITLGFAGYRAVQGGDELLPWINAGGVAVVLLVTGISVLSTLVGRNGELIRTLESEVSRRSQLESNMRRDLDQLRFVTENSTDTVWTMDLTGCMTFISSHIAQMRGYTTEEAMQMGASSFLPTNTITLDSLIRQRLEADQGADPDDPFTLRTMLTRKQGGYVDVEITARFLRDADGTPVGIVGATRNISERVRLDRAMESVIGGTRRTKGADFLASMAESLAEALGVRGVIISKLTSDTTMESVAFWMGGQIQENFTYELAGSPCEEMLSNGLSVVSYGKGVQTLFPQASSLVQNNIHAYVGARLFDENGRSLGIMACLHDAQIDDLKLSEDLLQIFAGHAAAELVRRKIEEESAITRTQLIQAQKLDSIGQLAGGIAHDFNNLLVVIQGYIDLARGKVVDQPELRQYHDHIQGATERAAKLTRQLLSFSRRQVLTKESVNLNDLIDGIQALLSRLLPENISVTFEAEPRLRSVSVDRNQVEQVIVNLCVNARDAMPDGGAIIFSTSNVEVDEATANTHSHIESGPFVKLQVVDTGRGMDEEVASRIFEPFFTTKPEGLGTGLGLSVLLGVIEQHGGFVHVHSQPGEGTAFSLYLPAVEAIGVDVVHTPHRELPGGEELVLVVEDEPMVMVLAQKMLESGGYSVIAAPDGDTALDLVRQHDDISLAVLDVVLPEVSGKELADQILETRPDLPMMFVSGYAPGGVHTNFVLEEGLTLLQKPYSRDDLLKHVRAVLDA